MKKLSLVFVFLMTVTFVFTGCGNQSQSVSNDTSTNDQSTSDEGTSAESTGADTTDESTNISSSNDTGTDNTVQSLPYEGESLMVYSGAGLSKAMDEVGQVFEEKYGAKVNLTYGACAQLLAQMEINKTGDVFVGGSLNDGEIAIQKGFTDTYVEIAYHIPAIAVPKGNPAGITSLADMANPGVKLILGDEESNAIGKKGAKIFEKNNIKAEIDANVTARQATVNEIVTQLGLKQGDAGLVWEDNGYESDEIDIISIPEEQNIIEKVPACTLSFTTELELSQAFVDFVSSDEGKEIFENHGFKTE